MSLVYSLISRGAVVLCEHTTDGHSGNFASICLTLLKKVDSTQDTKLSYLYDQHVFHYSVSNGLTFLLMSDSSYLRIHAFEYLREVEQKFISQFSERWKSANAYAFQSDFERDLSNLMGKFEGKKDTKIAAIQQNINVVKDTMILNLDKVIERGERIELLVEKSEVLDQHAFKFRREAVKLKRRMWWKNVKWWIIIAIVLTLVIYLILALSCGGPKLPKCS